MKRFALFLFSLHIVICSTIVAEDRFSDFSGKWIRDEIASKGKHLPSVTWRVEFDERTMTLIELSERGEMTRAVVYNLDGTASFSNVPNFPHKKMAHRLKLRKAHQSLELTDTMSGDPEVPGMSMIIRETWNLTKNGTVLRIVREVRPSGGGMELQTPEEVFSFHKVQEPPGH